MMPELDSDDFDRRITLASIFLISEPKIEQAIPLLRRGLTSPFGDVRFLSESALFEFGRRLTADQVLDFERSIELNKNDLATRIMLLGNYFVARHSLPEIGVKCGLIIKWVVENHPDSPVHARPECTVFPDLDATSYDEIRYLWSCLLQSQPNNA